MTKKELMKLSQGELAKACRNQGLDCSGDKAALADRLLEAHPEPEPEPEPEPAEPKPEE